MYPHDYEFVEILMLAQSLAPMDILGTMVICLMRKDCVFLNFPLEIL